MQDNRDMKFCTAASSTTVALLLSYFKVCDLGKLFLLCTFLIDMYI